MIHLIPFRPLINLVVVLFLYKGVYWKNALSIVPWLVKSILFEPLRLIEAFYYLFRKGSINRKPPIFILGFYRSGTTWLQQLLSCDPSFQTPTIFQTVLPEIMLLTEHWFKPVLQFISNKLEIENQYHRLPFDWDFPGEEDVAINAFSYICDFNKVYQYPSFAEKLIDLHFNIKTNGFQKKWLDAHSYFVDKLNLVYPDNRLILKSPPNTGRISLLKKMYPGAQFIFIKRDKQQCLVSNKRLWEINKGFCFENITDEQIKNVSNLTYRIFHERYYDNKNLLNPNEIVEVAYEDLVDAPMEVLNKIYKNLNLNDTEYRIKAQQKLIESRADYQPINHEIKENGK